MKTTPSRRKQRKLGESSSTKKGSDFEKRIQQVLETAKRESGGKITFKVKPKITLNNGEDRFPDFELAIDRPYERRQILVECQNRRRSTKPIAEKIQYIRARNQAQTFMFIYPERIGSGLAQTLDSQGVICLNLNGFRQYLSNLAHDVRASWGRLPNGTHDLAISSAQTMAVSPAKQVAFHTDPDAKTEAECTSDGHDSTSANCRPEGMETSFG